MSLAHLLTATTATLTLSLAVGCGSKSYTAQDFKTPVQSLRAQLIAQPDVSLAAMDDSSVERRRRAPASAPHLRSASADDRPLVTPSAEAAVRASSRSASAATNRLSVLTFNMEHRDRPAQLAVMAQHLRADLAHMPDFIILQEVMFNRSKSKGEDNTAEVLANTINYHCRGTKRTSDREGVAILSRHPFTYYADLELESQTNRLLLGFNRVSVMGEFRVAGVGLVRVVNVHTTNWGFEQRVRFNQIEETLAWIAQRERQVKADVIFLGGDFNMTPKSDEWELVRDFVVPHQIDFQDYNGNEPTRGSPGNPNKRIDYVFVSSTRREVKFIDETLLWTDGLRNVDGGSKFYLSDHVPILHEYTVGPQRLLAGDRPARPSVPVVSAATGRGAN